MAYGHAERTLAAIRLLEAQTRELLCRQDQLDPEEAQWLRDTAGPASWRLPECHETSCSRGGEPRGVRQAELAGGKAA
jgi:hypothetical protein